MSTKSVTSKVEYRSQIDAIIRDTLDEMQCQPILFMGSGISRRYAGLPDWMGLLEAIAKHIGLTSSDFSYISQKYHRDPVKIGSSLTDKVFEWAWSTGVSDFDPALFEPSVEKSRFIKDLAARIIQKYPPIGKGTEFESVRDEIEKLRNVKPHAIITTNYDSVLSSIFPDYAEVVGQKIIRTNLDYFGEIFKIHGCASQPETMVLNAGDYEGYRRKRKYLSAKLLTYLSEHPIFIFGYQISDENVVEIIDDVGEVLGNHNQLIPNLFYVQWSPAVSYDRPIATEKLIVGSQGSYRVRSIETDEFGWIFQALSQERELSGINTKLLRALLSRTYSLIRSDIPRKKVEVNYETLEHAVADNGQLPALLGISRAENTNMTHPYVLTQIGKKLGYKGWHGAHKLLDQIRDNTGIDIKKTDNRYHCRIKSGDTDKGGVRKWSDAALEILKKVKDGEDYTVEL